MKEQINIGDIVKSIQGHDKEKLFLVLSVENKKILIVNGKDRKIGFPKTKNRKHLKKVSDANHKDIAEKIQNGIPVSNKKLSKLLNAEKQKIQED